jgi:asparagine synthase (glutamine-hydrolysing)
MIIINFGHKRLSIIDLNPRSNQPFLDKQTGNILVFNGEIYNFKQIKTRINRAKKL